MLRSKHSLRFVGKLSIFSEAIIAVGEFDLLLTFHIVIGQEKLIFAFSRKFLPISLVLGDQESESPLCGLNFGLEKAERTGDRPIWYQDLNLLWY